MPAERLQKLIAAAGIASRRRAEALIAEGRVTLDGEVIRTPGVIADPAIQDIRVDGARLRARKRPRRYVVLNKPTGSLTTRSDPGRRPTVMDLLPESFRSLAPVGRLDGASSGLILLTDDGDLAFRVTHPKFRLPKTYYATVRGLPDEAVLDRARRGIRVDRQRLRLDQVEVMARFPHKSEGRRRARLRIVLRGGRNREIRRVLSVLGHPVLELHRTRIGNLVDAGLTPGRWRKLKVGEVEELRRLVGDGTGDRPAARRKPSRASRRDADGGDADGGAAERPDPDRDAVPEPFIVAIDGPAGSGKTTLARGVAARCGLSYFNTGASVRAVALAAMRHGVDLDAGEELRPLAFRVVLDPEGRVFLDGEDVSTAVRSPEVSQGASRVAVHPELREVLAERWRQAAAGGGVVEGRDIGTVVFPRAPVKVFLDARPEVRARRRSSDEGGRAVETVASELDMRDRNDSGRVVAPLRRADDAHRVDTSELTLEETVERVAALVEAARPANPPESAASDTGAADEPA